MTADDAPQGFRAASSRLEALRVALQAEIVALIERIDTEDGRVVSRVDRLGANDRIRSQVIELMRQQGIVALTVGEQAAMEEAQRILSKRRPVAGLPITENVSASFEAEALASIERTTSGALDPILAAFDAGADKMRAAIDLGVNTSAPLRQVVADVRDALDVTIGQARVAVDAAVRGANTAALVQQAERGGAGAGEPMGYLYDGPDDNKIRDFCAEHVGIVFTTAALARLDNGQGLPVNPFCGGFRCRHRLSPITIEDAIAEGYEVRQ